MGWVALAKVWNFHHSPTSATTIGCHVSTLSGMPACPKLSAAHTATALLTRLTSIFRLLNVHWRDLRTDRQCERPERSRRHLHVGPITHRQSPEKSLHRQSGVPRLARSLARSERRLPGASDVCLAGLGIEQECMRQWHWGTALVGLRNWKPELVAPESAKASDLPRRVAPTVIGLIGAEIRIE